MEELIKAIKAEVARIAKEKIQARAQYGRKVKKANKSLQSDCLDWITSRNAVILRGKNKKREEGGCTRSFLP